MPKDKQLEFLREEGAHPLALLKQRLQRWAARGVFLGTSSWKYEGWLGQAYTRDRYLARGKFSARQFEQHCLEEYAETFPTVCGDFSFYQFYSPAYWQRLFAQVPAPFQFGFKAAERITAPSFPDHDRYGALRGRPNEHFLDADLMRHEFLDPLRAHQSRVGYVVFQFPQMSRAALGQDGPFIERLGAFLRRLPDAFRYGVEIRNEGLLVNEYFDCLHRHRVAHVFNSWTRMPTIGEQLAMTGSITTDLMIGRALLRPGRTYEEAVRTFQPYDQVRDSYPQGYSDVAALIRAANQSVPKTKTFIAVNNRFVGNAIVAITEILDELERAGN